MVCIRAQYVNIAVRIANTNSKIVHVVNEREEEPKEHLGEAQDDGHLHFDRVHELELVQGVRPDGVDPEPIGVLELVSFVRIETDLLELHALDQRTYRLFTARKWGTFIKPAAGDESERDDKRYNFSS